MFTEEVNMIALTYDDKKRTQSIKSIETHGYGTRNNLIFKKGELKYNNKTKNTKMITIGNIT